VETPKKVFFITKQNKGKTSKKFFRESEEIMTTRNLRSGANPSANTVDISTLPVVATNRFAVLSVDNSLSMSSTQARANEAALQLLEREDENAREQIAQDIIAQNEPKTMAERMVEAKLARQNAKQEQLVLQGLAILYDQGDHFDFSSIEISDLNLSAESLEVLIERYIAKPTRDIQL
jgi:hypothetical protein